MVNLKVALIIILDAEESSDEETRHETELFKKRRKEGAYEVLISRHLFNYETSLKSATDVVLLVYFYTALIGYYKDIHVP